MTSQKSCYLIGQQQHASLARNFPHELFNYLAVIKTGQTGNIEFIISRRYFETFYFNVKKVNKTFAAIGVFVAVWYYHEIKLKWELFFRKARQVRKAAGYFKTLCSNNILKISLSLRRFSLVSFPLHPLQQSNYGSTI